MTEEQQAYCQEKRHGMYRGGVCGELTAREVGGVRYCEPHAKRAEADAAYKALRHESETMQAAGFEWEPTDAGYPRWTYRSKDIFCVRAPHVTDQQWEERKRRGIFEAQLDMPPSFFAQLGQPCCSRWCKSEIEWIALAYVQALANDGDTWKRLSREQTYLLLSDKQKLHCRGMLDGDFYDDWFQSISKRITDSDGAFSVGGFWHRGRA